MTTRPVCACGSLARGIGQSSEREASILVVSSEPATAVRAAKPHADRAKPKPPCRPVPREIEADVVPRRVLERPLAPAAWIPALAERGVDGVADQPTDEPLHGIPLRF